MLHRGVEGNMKKDMSKPSLKIAIIGHKRIPSNEGGIEKGVEEHAVRMAALGHQVVVYNRGGDDINGKQYNKERLTSYKGVRIVTVPTPNVPLPRPAPMSQVIASTAPPYTVTSPLPPQPPPMPEPPLPAVAFTLPS